MESLQHGLVLTLLTMAIGNTDAANLTHEAAVYAQVFTNYNKYIRPVGDNSHSVKVKIHIALHQVIFLNAEAQSLQNLVVITAVWSDNNLQWTPADNDNIMFMILPSSNFWLPDFGIANSAKKFYDEASNDFRLELKHTGEITWSFGGHVTTKCDVLVETFPFDKQHCKFAITNWMYDARAVNLSTATTRMDTSEYVRNVEWDLISTHCQYEQTIHLDRDGRVYPGIGCNMVLQRKPTYYVINMFVPSYFMLLLFLAAFCLPPGHRAIVPLQMTTLLIYSVMLLNISKQLPHTSHVPHITIFALVVIAMATLSIILTTAISVLRMYMDTSYRMPRKVRTVAFGYLAVPLCLKSIASDVLKKTMPEADVELADTPGSVNDVKFADKNPHLLDPSQMNIAAITLEQQLLQQVVMLSEQGVRYLTKMAGNRGSPQRAAIIRAEWDLLSKISARMSFWLILMIIVGLSIEFALSVVSQNAIISKH